MCVCVCVCGGGGGGGGLQSGRLVELVRGLQSGERGTRVKLVASKGEASRLIQILGGKVVTAVAAG